MLRAGLHSAGGLRGISNKARIVKSNVLRKVKRGIDRLPSQGPDPASSFKHGWRIASAAIVERYPVITPEADKFEEEYLTERFLEMQRRARPMPKEHFLSEKDKLEGRTEPNFDDPHADMYTPAPRRTEADHTNDTKSLERALDERLYFVVRRTDKSAHMQFPQVLAADDNVPLMHYAKQAFKGVTRPASRPRVFFLSYSPACHLQHVYPLKYQQKHDVYGIKIFFYRAMYLSGHIAGVRNATDHVWARRGELRELVGDRYYEAIRPALLGAGPTVRDAEA